MADWKQSFMCLMTRPREPLFYPKDNGKVFISLPEVYLSDRYRPMASRIEKRFGESAVNRISVKPVEIPDLGYAQVIKRNSYCNFFTTGHRQIAGRLVSDFMKQPDVESLFSFAAYCRDRLNPMLFQYALSVALMHRKDTRDIALPPLLLMFPQRFVDPRLFPRLREEGFVVDLPERVAIDIPTNYTASDAEVEQRLAYFREDIGINLHHWHWHLVYPMDGPLEIVNKDRRGELFYYMHRQLIARYNAERFCNKLSPVKPLDNLRLPLREPYFPKILNTALNRTYASRHANMTLSHINRPADDAIATILEIENWITRFKEAVSTGAVLLPNNERMPLDDFTGIDVLGNILENTILSVNIPYYGNIHNMMHLMISFIHDPENVYLEGPGTIGDIATAMRDPIFYRLHLYVDNLFELYKSRLTPYTSAQLGFPGVTISDVSVQTADGRAAINRMLTFWQRSQVDLAVGLDFGPEGNVIATFTHLQHAPFVYRISVINDAQRVRKGTVRIFLAPQYFCTGKPIPFEEQRRLAIELDKFVVNLTPGVNNIIRGSDESSVTIPYERSFRRQDVGVQPAMEGFRFCNCGWPDHMLLPKGTVDGMQYDLFVMVSDYRNDAVAHADLDESVDCNDTHSYCGLRDQRYPDRRAMGFPFDRQLPKDIPHMEAFTSSFSNMKRAVVEIRFTNTVISRT